MFKSFAMKAIITALLFLAPTITADFSTCASAVVQITSMEIFQVGTDNNFYEDFFVNFPDGSIIGSSGQRQNLYRWRKESTGASVIEKFTTPRDHEGATSITLLSDGTFITADNIASPTGFYIYRWRSGTTAPIETYPGVNHVSVINALIALPGNKFVSADSTGIILTWVAGTTTSVSTIDARSRVSGIYALLLLPDGSLLIGTYGIVRYALSPTAAYIETQNLGQAICALALLQDNTFLAAGTQSITRWTLANGLLSKIETYIDPVPNPGYCLLLTVLLDGTFLTTWTPLQTTRVVHWRPTVLAPIDVFSSSSGVSGIFGLLDGRFIISEGLKIEIWSTPSTSAQETYSFPATGVSKSFAVIDDNTWLGGYTTTIAAYGTGSSTLSSTLFQTSVFSGTTIVARLADGSFIKAPFHVQSFSANTMYVWRWSSVASTTPIQTFGNGMYDVMAMVPLPDGSFIVAPDSNIAYTIDRWVISSTATVTAPDQTFTGHTAPIQALAAYSSNMFLSASTDLSIRRWVIGTALAVETFTVTSVAMALLVLPDLTFISGGADGTLLHWRSGTATAFEAFEGHTAGVNCLALLPDGSFLSGSNDKKIKRWFPGTRGPLDTLSDHQGAVTSLAVFSDGSFTSSGAEGKVFKWLSFLCAAGGVSCTYQNSRRGMPCSLGTYCPAPTSPSLATLTAFRAQIPCPTGSYCPQKALTTYTPCASGTYNSVAGRSTACTNVCPPGSYCPTGSPTSIPCLAGTYTLTGGSATCAFCESGYYCPTLSSRLPCASGQYCAPLSTAASPCPAGSYCPTPTALSKCFQGNYCAAGSTAPTVCPLGSYCPSPESIIACSIGDYCPSGSTQSAKCPVGQFCSSASVSAACTSGSYCPLGSTTSAPCPVGYYCSSPATSIKCSAGQYCAQGSTQAVSCPAGSYCPSGDTVTLCSNTGDYCVSGLAAPAKCPAGSYCPDSHTSLPCKPGQYCPSGSVSPLPCPSGYYCSDPSYSVKCSSNQYCAQNSTVSISCLAGYFCPSPETMISCSAGDYCPSGSTQSTRCPAGQFCLTANSTELCISGSYCPLGSIVAAPCPVGYYCSTPSSSIKCYAGQYCAPGSTQARACPAGSYCPSGDTVLPCATVGDYCASGLAAPAKCPAGSYCPDSHTSLPCKPGQYCPSGSASPLPCPAGYYCSDPSYSVRCSIGEYCAQNSTASSICPAGSFCATSGVINQCVIGELCLSGSSQPTPCPAGYYCPTTIKAEKCDNGNYCPPGSSIQGICQQGYYCESPSIQIKCSYGLYCPSGQNSTGLCPAGSYCPTPDTVVSCLTGDFCPAASIVPMKCPAGSFCHMPSTKVLCASGQYCPEGTVTPAPCPIGSYCSSPSISVKCSSGQLCLPGSLAASPCPEGFYCATSEANITCSLGDLCLLGSSAPTNCPAGSYCNTTITSILCQDGQYCPIRSVSAQDCPKGFYCPNPTYQVACVEGQFCDKGSQAAATCPAGFFCPNPSTKVACSLTLGDYCPGLAVLTKCPSGYYCPTPTIKLPCHAGQSCPSGLLAALPCPSMYYCPNPEKDPILCPLSTTTLEMNGTLLNKAAAAATDCVCLPGYYSTGAAVTIPDNGGAPVSHCIQCGSATMVCTGVGVSVQSIRPADKFWRVNSMSTYMVDCPSCLWSEAPAVNATGCIPGHQGYACSDCTSGYAHNVTNNPVFCTKCSTSKSGLDSGSLLWIVIPFIALSPYLIYLVRNNLKDADSMETEQGRSMSSVTLRLIQSHLQALSLLGDFKMKWDVIIQLFFGVTTIMASASPSAVSGFSIAVDCFVRPKLWFLPRPFQNVVGGSCILAIISIFTVLFWVGMGCCGSKNEKEKESVSKNTFTDAIIEIPKSESASGAAAAGDVELVPVAVMKTKHVTRRAKSIKSPSAKPDGASTSEESKPKSVAAGSASSTPITLPTKEVYYNEDRIGSAATPAGPVSNLPGFLKMSLNQKEALGLGTSCLTIYLGLLTLEPDSFYSAWLRWGATIIVIIINIIWFLILAPGLIPISMLAFMTSCCAKRKRGLTGEIVVDAEAPTLFARFSVMCTNLNGYCSNESSTAKRPRVVSALSYSDKLVISLVSIFYTVHPRLVVIGFSLLDCRQFLDGEQPNGSIRLVGALDTRCFQGAHLAYLFRIGLPFFIIVVFGFPIAAYCMLRQNHHAVIAAKESPVPVAGIAKYSFLCKGYKEQYYYWELVIFTRKLILSLISVFMSRSSASFQGLIAVFVLVVSLVFQVGCQPYEEKSDEDLLIQRLQQRVTEQEAQLRAFMRKQSTKGGFVGRMGRRTPPPSVGPKPVITTSNPLAGGGSGELPYSTASNSSRGSGGVFGALRLALSKSSSSSSETYGVVIAEEGSESKPDH